MALNDSAMTGRRRTARSKRDGIHWASKGSAVPSPVFEAVADETRRSILDLLRDRGTVSAGDVARQFPHISRPAVSRHLRVLREARLVRSTSSGRRVLYELDERGFVELYETWFKSFLPTLDGALERLRARVESRHAMTPKERAR